MASRVRYELSRTINMGNYESMKVTIGVERDCKAVDEAVTLDKLKDFVQSEIEKEEKRIKL